MRRDVLLCLFAYIVGIVNGRVSTKARLERAGELLEQAIVLLKKTQELKDSIKKHEK